MMKSFSLVSAIFLAGAVASPQLVPFASEQFPLDLGEPISVTSYEGFHLDLNAERLVEMEGQAPVWMTELEKVLYSLIFATNSTINHLRVGVQIRAKAQGIKFFDM